MNRDITTDVVKPMLDYNAVTTALITPFVNDRIDYPSLAKIIDLQLNSNISQLVVLGTTAETPLLTDKEGWDILRFVKDYVDNRCKLIVGVGCPSTAKTIRNALKAQQLGADGLLVVAPYYTKCTEDGIVEHYNQIRKVSNVDIIAYNVPHRTGYSMSHQDIVTLYDNGLIAALKEASDNTLLVNRLTRTRPIPIMCGTDSLIKKFADIGYIGCISVMSNVAPTLTKNLTQHKSVGKTADKLAMVLSLAPSPVAIKYLAYKLGIITDPAMRLPLTALQGEHCYDLDDFVTLYRDKLL